MLAEKKIRILSWAVIVLGIMTLSIIVTILFNAKFSGSDRGMNPERFAAHWRGRAFLEDMNFSNRQQIEFHRLDEVFRHAVSEISNELDQKREALFAELEKPETDTAKCLEMSTDIGMLHRNLKVETYRFYLGVKKICTPQQKEKLKDVFAPVFSMEDGRRHGGGRRGGHHGWRH